VGQPHFFCAGRNFALEFPSELIVEEATGKQTPGILITRNTVKRFGFASPQAALGQTFRYSMDTEDRIYTVIGVVEDFRFSPIASDVSSVAVLQGTAEPLRTIAIRKVLGSSRRAILGLLLQQFTLQVLASFTLAVPIAIYCIRAFYSSFLQTPGFPVWLYAMRLAGIAALALMTVFTHCQRAATQHPIHSLRFE
jgi:putative ABC transport system permease protein